MTPPLLPLLATTLLLPLLPAQMEKRQVDQYADTEFAKAGPAVGAIAPDVCLWDLQGRPRSLLLERGRIVVLIGGAYT